MDPDSELPQNIPPHNLATSDGSRGLQLLWATALHPGLLRTALQWALFTGSREPSWCGNWCGALATSKMGLCRAEADPGVSP